MSGESDVAYVALIVSLIALFIAMGQLLGQMFATADGYRRCQDSVIGPWANKTRLVWHWSQFRFETKFTTPEIVFYDGVSFDNKASTGHELSLGLKRRSAKKIVADLEKAELVVKPLSILQIEGISSTNNDAVTWLAFLEQLSKLDDARRLLPRSVRSQTDTRVGIIYRERTWDLMPPDVSLPVASSKLGVIVALALRLGMSWENLELSNGFLRATGNGHTLISTTIRGLGITFQYTFTDDLGPMQDGMLSGKSAPPTTIEPFWSKATDLVRCGIVPGCVQLKVSPFPLAGQFIHETSRYLRAAFQHLDVAEPAINHLTQHTYLRGYRELAIGWDISLAVNDMIALCSECWPGLERMPWPLETDIVFSSFQFFEMREKYFQELSRRIAEEPAANDHLKSVAEKLLKIRTNYADDFFCRWEKAIVTNSLTPVNTRTLFFEELTDIHMWTTEYFQRLENIVPYRHFVALHVMLILDAARYVFPQKLEMVDSWEAIVANCVKNLPNLHVSSVPFISESGGPGLLSKKEMEQAWWTLILRGIAWKMMQHHMAQETAIPSKFYLDQTPVYIM